MEQRKGDWMETYAGVKFYALDPRPEDICIEDIAHSLANQCRYAGHVKRFYSVAQHSVIVSQNLPSHLKLWGLLHDASEAYLVDLPRPSKNGTILGVEYKKIESVVQTMIYNKFGLFGDEPAMVKEVDNRMIPTERRDLMSGSGYVRKECLPPLEANINPWNPDTSENVFLCEFFNLMENRWASK